VSWIPILCHIFFFCVVGIVVGKQIFVFGNNQVIVKTLEGLCCCGNFEFLALSLNNTFVIPSQISVRVFSYNNEKND